MVRWLFCVPDDDDDEDRLDEELGIVMPSSDVGTPVTPSCEKIDAYQIDEISRPSHLPTAATAKVAGKEQSSEGSVVVEKSKLSTKSLELEEDTGMSQFFNGFLYRLWMDFGRLLGLFWELKRLAKINEILDAFL